MSDKGKNKRRQLEVFDETHSFMLSVDSAEEVDFVRWCDEAVKLSVLNGYQYQPDSFQLFQAEKYVDVYGKQRTLFQEHIYSPDFVLMFNPKRSLELSKELKVTQSQLSSNECSAYIDVKGTFQKQKRSFTTDRKWTWQKFKTYICEVVPVKFFKLFGVPEKSRLTEKTKKPRSCYNGFKSVAEAFRQSDGH